MAQFASLVQETITFIRLQSGTGMQRYAEDSIAQKIQASFDMLFDRFWWDQFMSWQTFTLDGVSGLIVEDASSLLKSYTDIKLIYRGGTNDKVPELPSDLNPNTVTGTIAKFKTSYANATKIFQVYPLDATGTLDVRLRTKPADFLPNDEINFDKWALVFMAAWLRVTGDGTNPGEGEAIRSMLNDRLETLQGNDAQNVVLSREYGTGIQSEWV